MKIKIESNFHFSVSSIHYLPNGELQILLCSNNETEENRYQYAVQLGEGEAEKRPTTKLSDYVREYLLAAAIKDKTRQSYMLMSKHLEVYGDCYLHEITTAYLQEFIHYLQKSGLKAGTVRLYFQKLACVLHNAYKSIKNLSPLICIKPIFTKCFCVSLLFFCICLLYTACQHNSNFNDNTTCKIIVHDDSTNNRVLDIAEETIVPCHLNADIALNDSTFHLHPGYSLYKTICDYLGLNDPIIMVFGYKDIGNLRLLKLHAEDIMHDHLYVLLFDNNGHFVDSICSPEPVKGDQLGYDNGVPVEWHYYSNFYFNNELEKVTTSCDLKMHDERIDTLYYSVYRTKYKVDKNKFVEYTKDSVIKGNPF